MTEHSQSNTPPAVANLRTVQLSTRECWMLAYAIEEAAWDMLWWDESEPYEPGTFEASEREAYALTMRRVAELRRVAAE